jgi:hypothetical protein
MTWIRNSSNSGFLSQRHHQQQPNRMTTIFSRMKETCPDSIKLYAQCVIQHQKDGTLDHKSCEEEFRSVKDCFRSVRSTTR